MMNLPNYRSRLVFLISVVLLFTGCRQNAAETQTNDENKVSATATPEKPLTISATSGSFFAINEVGLGPNGYVGLTNFTDVLVSTDGLILCQGSDCFELPDSEVKVGETVLVAVGDGSGLEGVIAKNATIGELRASDGELALFSSNNYDDPKAILVYLQWGSTPHELTPVAVEAGLWFETSYAPSSDKATRLYRVPESGLWLFEE